MFNPAIHAYQTAQRSAMTRRETEATAFTRAASLLDHAMNNPGDRDSYHGSLRFNQRLWTIVQSDLTHPKNRLPDRIKANLMSLSIFVDRQTLKALGQPKAEHLKSLRSIDRNIASGLFAPPPEESPAPETSGVHAPRAVAEMA